MPIRLLANVAEGTIPVLNVNVLPPRPGPQTEGCQHFPEILPAELPRVNEDRVQSWS